MNVSKNAIVFVVAAAALVGFVVFNGKPKEAPAKEGVAIRVAYMPNLTHAPAVYGFQKGSFKADLPDTNLSGVTFNAGPEEMEAIRAGAIDIAFVGPGPLVQSLAKGEEGSVVFLDGSCQGGASLVSRPDLKIAKIADLAGHSVAVPQLGGSQDISLRHFLAEAHLASFEKGGTVKINAIRNADLPLLFAHGQIDAAWVPEPWASILVVQHGAKLVVDERDLWPGKKFPTTVLVARKQFAKEHPDLVKRFKDSHAKAIEALNADPVAGLQTVGEGLSKLTGKKIPKEVLDPAGKSLTFSTEVLTDCLQVSAQTQLDNGYLKKLPTEPNWLAVGSEGVSGR